MATTKLIFVIQFLVLSSALTIIIGECFGNRDSSPKVVCIEAEKQALVSVMRDLVDPENVLSFWLSKQEEDCCKWNRIKCDNRTGHVLELNLGHASLSGKVSPSLLHLKHLTRLNLSFNDFKGIPIPSFLGSLVRLRFLDLTYAEFAGMIPQQLGNLSSLQELRISNKDLHSKSLDWISGLSSLEYLDMSNVNLSEASSCSLLALNNLRSLIELRLSSCDLHSAIRLPSRLNLTSLRVLQLSYNTLLQGPLLFGFIKNMTNLQSIDMSYTRFGPTIPNFIYSLTTLENLNLALTGLQGFIPSNIGNLSSVISLDLSLNSLQGNMPMSMGNLCNLERIDSSNNEHNGNLSEAFQSLSSGCLSNRLSWLRLDDNLFSGHITDQIKELKNLSRLSIARNNISGPIPVSLGSLSNIEDLDISSNHLTGVVSEAHFANLTNLKRLDASRNSLTLKVSPEWIPPFDLSQLDLGSWKLGPQFPLWLKSQKKIQTIGLSNTGISGSIPNWLSNSSKSYASLDLSWNQLSGHIPNWQTSLILDLSSNQLTGPLPRITYDLQWLDISNNSLSGDIHGLLCSPEGNNEMFSLIVLKLKDNLLAGDIPECWSTWPSLSTIDLANNNLNGQIPISLGLLQYLRSLHLRNNSLTGEIPNTLRNCSELVGLDLGLNKLVGSIPRSIGSLASLMVLNLRSNKLNGHIPIELCALVNLRILDVAHNKLSGNIPTCFKNFKSITDTDQALNWYFYYSYSRKQEAKESTTVATKGSEYLYEEILHLMSSLDLSSNHFSGEIPEELVNMNALKSLNLSRNHFHGRIPSEIGNMNALESLDLSWNQLSGEIPESMSDLNFLNYLNLSYNDLSGEIPKSTQLQSLSSSGFIGNQLLCGDPLLKKCRDESNENNLEPEEEEDDDGEENYWFRVGIGMGFGVSLVGIIAPLLIFKMWRRAYFWFFQEYVWYKILDAITTVKYKIGISTPTYLA